MSEIVWRLVPANPTEDMIAAATDVRPGCGSYGDIASRCVRDWNAMLKAAPHAPALVAGQPGRAVTVEDLARHMFESDDPAAQDTSWPEHDEDDGYRGDGGWSKIASVTVLEEYREKAAALLRFMGCEAGV
ncbi:hypothetical protein HFN89_01460 [Rhizobium laguerreae]|nr:hypothetical protein [Rhizobium laguerreae]